MTTRRSFLAVLGALVGGAWIGKKPEPALRSVVEDAEWSYASTGNYTARFYFHNSRTGQTVPVSPYGQSGSCLLKERH